MEYSGNLVVTTANSSLFEAVTSIDGELRIEGAVTLLVLLSVSGDVIVESCGDAVLPALSTVGKSMVTFGKCTANALRRVDGACHVREGGELSATALEAVGTGLFLYPEAQCRATRLRLVDGGLSINSPASFPDLVSVGGGMVVNSVTNLEQLCHVGDYLYVFAGTSLPRLRGVGGDLVVHAGATLEGDRIASVGARLVLHGPAELASLRSVGGDLYASVAAELPALTLVGGAVHRDSTSRFNAPSYVAAPASPPPPASIGIRAQPSSPPVLSESSRWTGRQWAAMGTSVTAFGAYNWPLAKMLGARLTNLGVGGGSLSTSARSSPAAIYRQIARIPHDAALVTFEAGMIDFRENSRLGVLYDTALDTFHGAVFRAIADTLAANPRRVVVFITPLAVAAPEFECRWDAPNDNGDLLGDFIDAIRNVCGWCGVPVIDAGSRSGIGGPTLSIYTSDGVHLNQAGGLRLAGFLYDHLQLIRPFPDLPGAPTAGIGEWVLRAADAQSLSGVGLTIASVPKSRTEGVVTTQDVGYYFSTLWLTAPGEDAAEFLSMPYAGNSLWITFGSGPAGWIGVGDLGNLGAQKIATFAQDSGSVNFGEMLTASWSVEPNATGMRWRVRRCDETVDIYQQRPADGLWVQVFDPIILSKCGFNDSYYRDVRIGILATQGSAAAILHGNSGCGQTDH